MAIKGIIFNLYGTLINIETDETRSEIYCSIAYLLDSHKILLSPDMVQELYWRLLKRQISESKESFPEIDVILVWEAFLAVQQMPAGDARHNLAEAIAQLFRAASRKRLLLYPEVKSTLDELQKSFSLALVSDAQACFALPEMRALGLENYFQPEIISADYGFRKPDSKMFHKAIAAMNLKADEAVYVGNDMYRDVYGAQLAGLKAIYVDSGKGEKVFADTRPDCTAKNFAEIIDGIRNLHISRQA